MSLGNLKIAARLMVGFGLLVVLIASLSGYAVHSGRANLESVGNVFSFLDNGALMERIDKRMFSGRMQLWIALATGEPTYWEKSDADFARSRENLKKLIENTSHPERRAKAEAVSRDFEEYLVKVAKLRTIGGKNPALETPEAKALAADVMSARVKLDEKAESLTTEYRQAGTEQGEVAVKSINRGIDLSILVGAISVVIGMVLAFFISRSITNPVNAMTRAMGVLAGGDTSVEIPATGQKDEIGEMAHAVQVFKDNAIRVKAMQKEQEDAKARAEAERKQAMLNMADSFESAVMGLVKGVSAQASEMQATSQSMSAGAQQTSAQAATVAAAAQEATANVQTVAAAAEELSSSISEISRQVAEAAQVSATASEETARTNAMVQGLAHAADKIGEVVSLINDIAAQTNLLALNATIEAARAGDAGKGFAVVANEVKNLANQTARATEEISSQVGSVQEETRRAVDAIRNIATVIEQVQQISSGIASAVEEQGAATAEIARNVQEAAKGTQDVSANVQGITQTASETGAASQQVLAASGELARNSETLRAEVDKFLDGVRAG
ncbi:methyl-accepting chemotaxis protein [Paramagnetospirillum magneticum]|uniref:Methyl-accepting chemotaxis protein n=1 Tax=Paramagnetospirillum magneticum (strain ATCC 700264 / AMB-1) TaxID=342108 RepID=Q2W0Y1_PARM1|nr:HAMP domain-containing methyl-accepting chemotaxis protein [Paramagnetospirillum magneticum]BAE52494.1 Methyl-accepting chemotaxis protein [Paramagnetospirillum magneticum AMB-1]